MSLLTLTCVAKLWTNVIIVSYRYQLKHSLDLISTKIITGNGHVKRATGMKCAGKCFLCFYEICR